MDPASSTVNTDAPKSAMSLWLKRVGSVLWLAFCAWAIYGLYEQWSELKMAELQAALARLKPGHIALAILFTVLSYLCSSALGILGHRWLGHRSLGTKVDWLHNYITSAFTMNAGGSVIGGGSIRLRFSQERGLSAPEVSKVTAFTAVAGWAGHMVASGLLMLFATPNLPWVPVGATQILGAVLSVIGLVLPCAGLRWPGVWPPVGYAYFTLLTAVFDWLFAGLAMWALFPSNTQMNPWSLVAVVVVAQGVAGFTHVPGGVGVLEFAMTKALGNAVAAPVLVGVLLAYRLIYYLLPFGTAIVCLGLRELHVRPGPVGKWTRLTFRGIGIIAPRVAALLALSGGFMLLLSAYTPIEDARRGIVALVPIHLVEASHFISSLMGALLIVLARGLQRRIQAAWWLTVMAMAGSVVFSLVKGFDWEESLVLLFMLACLLPSRSHFHRQAALWTYRFTLGWWLVLAALVSVSVWVGFEAARDVAYEHQLWWQFDLWSDASRFLRAMTAAGSVFIIVAMAQALRPSAPRKSRTRSELAPTIDALVRSSLHTDAVLAWLGDKEFTISKDGKSGLMHADSGRSRIVMGDPLGTRPCDADLLWQFVEQAEDQGMRPVFYQISIAEMPRLVDMGFKLYKLGEEARVDLAEFKMEGGPAKTLRKARSRCQREGYKFIVWTPEQVTAHMPKLQAISDAWLSQHGSGEKGFSLGSFKPDYLSRMSCAVVLDPQGEPIAFANIVQTAHKQELSVDLMRHIPDTLNGVMDMIFTELILMGKEQGYRYFNLGMAPLSGISTHPLAPLWNKIAARIFRRGGALYNFQGLRSYKEKFCPEWSPRYIAVLHLWALPSALIDATTLIGGGLRNTISKASTPPSTAPEPAPPLRPAGSA